MTKTAKTPRREFLPLGKPYDPAKHNVTGWYLSEKFDGTRCLWDGGNSRGKSIKDVPYASIHHPKTGELKPKLDRPATGLWSRYGNPIFAPDWFLDQLPEGKMLDGELWAGRGKFQATRSIVARDTPDERWRDITFKVFDLVPPDALFSSGLIKNANFVREIDFDTCYEGFFVGLTYSTDIGDSFAVRHGDLRDMFPIPCESVQLVNQIRVDANTDIDGLLAEIVAQGGEGLILKNPESLWLPKRSGDILKVKPKLDAEATIVGYTSGRETEKGSKHLGKIGALILDFNGKRLELSGLTDAERVFDMPYMEAFASENPGVDMPSHFQARHEGLRLGCQVTFLYRELSDDGVPKEARYLRPRVNV